MTIIPLTHKHAHAYIIDDDDTKIMFDAGWPSSFPVFKNIMRENGIVPGEIKYLVVSYFHPDHAGIVQIMKDHGTTLLLHECQKEAATQINSFFIKHPDEAYCSLVSGGNHVITTDESQTLLREIRFCGEIIPTPGHSADSVSLVMDRDCAFTGDLPPLETASMWDGSAVSKSWRDILSHGIKTVYPAHGLSYAVPHGDA